jgi:mono/diheme cytochrome c family protein
VKPAALVACAVFAGCSVSYERMIDQARGEDDAPNPWSADGVTAQLPPDDAVAVDAVREVEPADDVRTIPIGVDEALLARGQNRFEIFCAPCHGLAGNGQSVVARAMQLRPPPSLVAPPVSLLAAGHVFRVATHGYGMMPAYESALSTRDRWAVTAYVEVLRLSQRAELARLPEPAAAEARRWLR